MAQDDLKLTNCQITLQHIHRGYCYIDSSECVQVHPVELGSEMGTRNGMCVSLALGRFKFRTGEKNVVDIIRISEGVGNTRQLRAPFPILSTYGGSLHLMEDHS